MRNPTLALAVLALVLHACSGDGSGEGTEGDANDSTTGGEQDPFSLDDDLTGDPDDPEVRHAEVSAIETLGISGPEAPWAQMSYEDRELYMIGKVLPITHELFMRMDAQRHRNFSCEGCHGSNGRERRFEMPSTERSVVHPEGTPQHQAMERTFPDLVRFMKEELTPTTATLLGIEGFSCSGCHPTPG